MESEIVDTGDYRVWLGQNVYDVSGDDVTMKYRTVAVLGDMPGEPWVLYTAPFNSLGYTQIRLEATGLGLLSISGDNTRYFVNGAGTPVYLAGAHTWNNMQDMGTGNPPAAFDYSTWLSYINTRGHNVFRMWAWEQSRWSCEVNSDNQYFYPNVYGRSGTSGNNDGGNKWDLTTFNQDYFDRLRARVIEAGNLGMYCIVMFFNGWSIGEILWASPGYKQPFDGHPYNATNNINSIDGDTNDDGDGYETQQDSIAAVTTLQKALIVKFVDTLNDLDNVLWEICNEAGDATAEEETDWETALVTYLRSYEAGKAKQHLIGVNMPVAYVDTIGADWTSANGIDSDMDDPPEAAGTYGPSVLDSDHNGGIVNGWNPFRHFCKGHGGVLYMDNYDGSAIGGGGTGSDDRATVVCEYTRYNLGYVLDYAARMDLLNCTPQSALCSTGYCLRKADTHYLCYQPGSANFTLDLTEASGTFTVEWLECADGTVSSGGTITGGAERTLDPPGTDYVAFVYK